jgi:hypothetical protein
LARERGEYSIFYTTRVRAIRLINEVKHIGTQALWDAAPRDDLGRVAEEFVALYEALDIAMEQLLARADDDEMRAKIAKMIETNGRTPKEMAVFRAGAQNLKKKLLPTR